MQGLADSTQLQTFKEQAQQDLQRLHTTLESMHTGRSALYMRETLAGQYECWTGWPPEELQNEGFGGVITLAAAHVQLTGLLGELQHSMAQQDADHMLRKAWQPLTEELPTAVCLLSTSCRLLAQPNDSAHEMLPREPHLKQVWQQPELTMLMGCVVLAYNGAKIVRAFLQLSEQHHHH